MIRSFSAAVAASALLASVGLVSATGASAAPQLQRVRGTVVSATDSSVTVKEADGKSQVVTLSPDTAFVDVVKSSLENVTDGKFIGTATKGEPPVAIEVVIFPASMKGTGEGHYDWDSIHDTGADGKGLTKSAMTNGTIKTSSPNGAMTKSAMTNGTVKATPAAGGSGKKIDVTYDNGQSLSITVPPSAPIVEFVKSDKSVVKPGATIFTVTTKDGDKLTSKLFAVGKDGVTPPM